MHTSMHTPQQRQADKDYGARIARKIDALLAKVSEACTVTLVSCVLGEAGGRMGSGRVQADGVECVMSGGAPPLLTYTHVYTPIC